MKRSKTETIITALRILADDIVSEDGVASAAIREAAGRLAELHADVKKPCTWGRKIGYADSYEAACGYVVTFGDFGGLRGNDTNYCPRCGGRVKVERSPG